jgi:diacylglycerol kinase family enzyme
MVERLFLLKRCFLPFQFAGQTSADTFEASPICARVACKTTVVFNIFNLMSRSTSDMESARVDLSELKVGAIINTSSGGCGAESEAEMLDLLKGANVSNCKTWCGESDQIERAFAEAATQELKILIVLGGDGTIRTAAEACTGTGTYLLPLPGGTLNMLPRALYGDASWQNALKDTLADPAIKVLSGGRVGEKLFFVAAVVGAPGLWMEAREAMREGDILDAVHKSGIAFEAMFDTTIQYFISPEVSGEAEVVTVICPLVSEQMSDSEQTLEAAAIAVANAAEVLGLATAAAFGKWRENKRVTLSKTQRVEVQSSGDIPLFLDGEKVKVGKIAEVTFVPKAVNVIVPANLSTKFS